MKAKINEINIVRAIAILAVLIIHGTSNATVDLNPVSYSQHLYLALNKFSNFAVPVFILISGLVLFYRYVDSWNTKEMVGFYRKRLQQILIPYLLWSLFYNLFNQWLLHPSHPELIQFHPKYFLSLLPLGSANYHLYFISIITQFYVIFPILMYATQRFLWVKKYLIWISAGVQVGFYSLHHWFVKIPHSADLFVTYFVFFCVGGWIGMNYPQFSAWVKRFSRSISAAAVLLGVSYALLYVLMNHHIYFPIPVYDLVFNLYPFAMGFALLLLGKRVLQASNIFSTMLNSIGTASFGIYFMHPIILSLWRTFIQYPGNIWLYHVYTASELLLAIVIPWGVTRLYQQRNLLRPLSRQRQNQHSA